jgi:amino acid efflux transporter
MALRRRENACMLSTRSATALYVGAVLGPGVLLLPALAARIAGPASVLAWAGLLLLSVPLAITFAALGTRWPEAGGTASYVRAAFGARAGTATGWWFLCGVAVGAPAVALIGGFYVAELVGGGRTTAVIAAVAMIGCVLVANATGLHTTARLQLGLAGLLAAMLLVAVVTALPHSEGSNWTPFAPHGWGAVGSAASVLMFAFFGWEAVSHLAGELRDPGRQLPRAMAYAFAVVAILYLGLATAAIGVGASSDVPLADLMAAGLGETGRRVTAVLAVLLTMGTMNTYVAAASQLAGALVPGSRPLPWLGAVAAVLLVPLALDLLSVDALMKATSAAFVAVYVVATAAGVRLLSGRARVAAAIGFGAVLVVFGFSGAYVLVPLVIGVVAVRRYSARRADVAATDLGTVTNA